MYACIHDCTYVCTYTYANYACMRIAYVCMYACIYTGVNSVVGVIANPRFWDEEVIGSP